MDYQYQQRDDTNAQGRFWWSTHISEFLANPPFIWKADTVLSTSLTPSADPPHDHFAAEAAHR